MGHIDDLKKARIRLVGDRRAFATALSGPYERGKSEEARAKIIEKQAAIEAIDRAIADEEGEVGS